MRGLINLTVTNFLIRVNGELLSISLTLSFLGVVAGCWFTGVGPRPTPVT